MEDFEDLVEANQRYAAKFEHAGLVGLAGRAAQGVAVVTCMDSRIEPLGMLGLVPGDAKILRNPGGRVDHHTLESLVVAVHLLAVTRVMIVPHTRCAMTSMDDDQLRAEIARASGHPDATLSSVRVTRDQIDSLADDVQKVRTHSLIPDTVMVGGFVYDVDTGLIDRKF